MSEQTIKNPLNFKNNKTSIEDMLEEKYANLNTCGVLYFEVNKIEEFDTVCATEERHKIFLKLEDSVKKLQSEEIHVYNCGIDGFILIGINYSKEQIRNLAKEWIKEWESFPEYKKGGNKISIGMAWDSAPVSLKELMVKAVEEMLYNRKLIEEGIPMDYCVHGEIFSSFGLLTRKQFFKNVDFRLKKDCGKYCIVAIDIEHFKLFNKWNGRSAGDALLTSFAESLQNFEKEYNGIAAYFGGDNFVILLPDNTETVTLLANTLMQTAMGKVKTVGFLPAFGVYRIENRDLDTVDMYDYALEALSQVLGHYEKRICYYEKDITSNMEKEIDIVVAAREALKHNEFTIYLQPQVRIHPVKIIGAEALVRWISPKKGMISPGEFIPALEKNGFIGEVDQYVWELVCKSIHDRAEQGIEPVPVSINVSRIDILSFDVVQYLNSLTEKYDIDKKFLKVEITESAYVDNTGKVLDTIEKLRKSGYTLMMDDFGSGYSSLNMLREAIVDIIKLDMRFLDMDDDSDNVEKGIRILKSVINMSNEIRMPIVIEGVETDRQADFLRDMGVWFAQGYLYYKPMPIQQFAELISVEENVDRRGIYNEDIDIRDLDKAIDKMLRNRNKRYEKIEINKMRGGFLEYEADGRQNLLNVTQSVAYMFGCDSVEEFREYVGNSFMGMVHPKDRERVEYEINAQIYNTKWQMDYIEYRIIRKDGQVRYVYDYGHLEEKKEMGKNCFSVFLVDVTDKIK